MNKPEIIRRVKRTLTELRLRRDTQQTYFEFMGRGELEKLIATRPEPTLHSEHPVVEKENASMKAPEHDYRRK